MNAILVERGNQTVQHRSLRPATTGHGLKTMHRCILMPPHNWTIKAQQAPFAGFCCVGSGTWHDCRCFGQGHPWNLPGVDLQPWSRDQRQRCVAFTVCSYSQSVPCFCIAPQFVTQHEWSVKGKPHKDGWGAKDQHVTLVAAWSLGKFMNINIWISEGQEFNMPSRFGDAKWWERR